MILSVTDILKPASAFIGSVNQHPSDDYGSFALVVFSFGLSALLYPCIIPFSYMKHMGSLQAGILLSYFQMNWHYLQLYRILTVFIIILNKVVFDEEM